MAEPFTRDPTCDLCKAKKMTPWFHEDDLCWIAECDVCAVPMVVWRFHGRRPPDEDVAEMRARLAEVAAREVGARVWQPEPPTACRRARCPPAAPRERRRIGVPAAHYFREPVHHR
jgi:hypothetical protein